MHPRSILLTALALYIVGFALWYSTTPLGMVAVLDGRENIQLGLAWQAGEMAGEAFYRAPLYPALIAILSQLGIPADALPFLLRLFNLFCHGLNAFLVGRLALRLWANRSAAWTAAVLYGLYPVALHFAVDPLDITPAITLCLAALLLLYPGAVKPPATTGYASVTGFLGGGLLTLACLTRPHFLVLLPLAPLLAGLRFRAVTPVATTLVGIMIPLFIFGWMNQQRSGQWHFIPTQGTYNLWAANKPGSHGKYFEQSISLRDLPSHVNPTYLESLVLFEREHGQPPESIAEANHYWRQKLVHSLFEQPVLHVRQLLTKTYYLIHPYEQYNNKTYAFHRARTPWLAWNPLGWGILLAGGIIGLLWGKPAAPRWPLLLAIAVYAAGVLLFFVSARFRLPLVPFIAVAAAGLATVPWRRVIQQPLVTLSASKWIAAAVTVAAVLILSLSDLADVRDPRTFAQDHLLTAQAAAELGDDPYALKHADAALEIDPDLLAATELKVITTFNLLLSGTLPIPDSAERASQLELSGQLADLSSTLTAIHGFHLAASGQQERAIELWEASFSEEPHPAHLSLIGLGITQPQRAILLLQGHSIPPQQLSPELQQLLSGTVPASIQSLADYIQ